MKPIYYIFFKYLFYIKLYGSNFKIGKQFRLRGDVFIKNKGRFIVLDNVKVNSGLLWNPIGGDVRMIINILQNATLEIGNNTGLSNSTIVCSKSIKIGDNCIIGGGVRIYDTDFHSLNPKERTKGEDIPKISKVVIEDNCFIGTSSIILKGSYIGTNTIVGAGSVVSGNLKANSIYAGNPAKFIRYIDIND